MSALRPSAPARRRQGVVGTVLPHDGEPFGVAHCFELDRAEGRERRMQPLAIVDLLDEAPDIELRASSASRYSRPSISSCLSVFMKLSALALS